MGRLLTIGYSGLNIAGFVDLLRDNAVDVVCDVRSTPFSRYKPDFSRGPLKKHLNAAGLKYLFMGEQLGARPKDRGCYEAGQATYDRIAKTEPFKDGITRVRSGIEEHTLALVCSERDPIECHRAILVCHRLGARRDDVIHIHTDGHLEEQLSLDERLVTLHALAPMPLLSDPGDWRNAVAEAYRRQSTAIGYREKSMEPRA